MIDKTLLAPVPKILKSVNGVFKVEESKYIYLKSNQPQSLVIAATQTGLDWQVSASPMIPSNKLGLTIETDPKLAIPSQGYELSIRPEGITIRASDPAGAFYGASTLSQLIRQYGSEIPCLDIEDSPDYPVRGVMLDISRDKVPTMQTLFNLIDLLAEWKINQFQLYTEHTFAYLAHPTVWKNASPMTGEEILELDAYCKERFIELVPNQNSFAHMDRWLNHDEYRSLAELPNGGDTSAGYIGGPFSICPVDDRSIQLLNGLYDELLPHFTSKYCNVGADETVDLGYGRSKETVAKNGVGKVYMDFLLKLYESLRSHDRIMMFWGDIILNHPELIPELPKDVIALNWGYEFDHPFDDQGAKFAAAGIKYYVCPGASNWNSYVGRTDNALGNLENSARIGLKHGSIGYLNTSWGDLGHWDPLPVAYLGFLAGACASWNSKPDIKENFAERLSVQAFQDPTGKIGRTFYDLGNLYLCFKRRTPNLTIQNITLINALDNKESLNGVTINEFEEMEYRLKGIKESMSGNAMNCWDSDIIEQELDHMFSVMRLSAKIGKHKLGGPAIDNLKEEVSKVRDFHRVVWLLRNRPGGLEDSVRKIVAEI